jgi:hypothetical protein
MFLYVWMQAEMERASTCRFAIGKKAAADHEQQAAKVQNESMRTTTCRQGELSGKDTTIRMVVQVVSTCKERRRLAKNF